jgi:P4 family phage/plasmid primase-like protien
MTKIAGKAQSVKLLKKVEMESHKEILSDLGDPGQPGVEPTISITNCLGASDKNYERIKLSEVSSYLKSHNECYERTQPTEDEPTRVLNRVYVDIDGEMPFECDEATFDEKHKEITDALKAFCVSEGFAMMEASKWKCADDKGDVSNKLSYRLNHPKQCGKKADIKFLVEHSLGKKLVMALQNIIPVQLVLKKKAKDNFDGKLIIDLSVYNDGQRKMRMLHQTKRLQKRPNKLVLGSETDVLITYVPSDCKRIAEPISIFKEEPKDVIVPKDDDNVSTNGGTFFTGDPTEDDVATKQQVANVLENVGQHRWDYYPDWIRIGFILFNEGFTMDEFIEMSKKSKHWKNGSSPQWVKEKWKGFRRSQMSQEVLWKWLYEDNVDAYAELSLTRRDFWNLIKNPSHAETARYFYNLKPDAYAFNEKLGWFQILPSNIWKHYDQKPSGLLADIWNTFRKVYKQHQQLIDLKAEDEATGNINKARLKNLQRFASGIGNKTFCDGVIAFLPSMYNDDELDRKMDEQRHLIAFTDKVYDLDRHEARPIRPEDYICLNTGYAYPEKRHPSAQIELSATLRTLFETTEDCETKEEFGALTCYALQSVATCLHGTKKYEKFYVWTGNGGNGKGLLSELIKRTFGDYYHSIPHSCLTKVQDKKDAPNPPIAKAKGKRFVQASEPEAEDRLQAGVVKQYSGGDEITARDMYRSTVTYRPQFGLFLQTNAIPKLNRADGGVQRRMEVLEFPFKFIKEPTEASHKPINEDLKDKIIKSPEWRDEMFHTLLEAYKHTESGGLNAPESVKVSSQEYMDENNPVKEWLNNTYETNKDAEDRRFQIGSMELKDMFQQATNHNISSDKFKMCMMLLGVRQKKERHPYNSVQYNEFNQEWEPHQFNAGKYWCGLLKKGITPPG